MFELYLNLQLRSDVPDCEGWTAEMVFVRDTHAHPLPRVYYMRKIGSK